MTINTDPSARLAQYGAATLYEAQGQRGAMNADIKPIDTRARLAGRAFTLDAHPADNLMIHYALTKTSPGDVLVVDAKGFLEAGPWGDVLTVAALEKGLAGLIINGAVRDAATIEQLGFPVFSKGLSIKGTTKIQSGAVGVPIICGGIRVAPGDYVVGDRDGVVVVATDAVEAVLAAAADREEKEARFRSELRAGRSTVDLLGLSATLDHLGLD
jgi:4-hydroxy-4-methyl-2-oxoglutarate aldolase